MSLKEVYEVLAKNAKRQEVLEYYENKAKNVNDPEDYLFKQLQGLVLFEQLIKSYQRQFDIEKSELNAQLMGTFFAVYNVVKESMESEVE